VFQIDRPLSRTPLCRSKFLIESLGYTGGIDETLRIPTAVESRPHNDE